MKIGKSKVVLLSIVAGIIITLVTGLIPMGHTQAYSAIEGWSVLYGYPVNWLRITPGVKSITSSLVFYVFEDTLGTTYMGVTISSLVLDIISWSAIVAAVLFTGRYVNGRKKK